MSGTAILLRAFAIGLLCALWAGLGAMVGGHIPRIGPLGEAFRAGFYGLFSSARGVPGSLQRLAWQAGRKRGKVEPDALAQIIKEGKP